MSLTYAIGDVHGCIDALTALLDLIAQDADGDEHRVIFLGDYIDRGAHSAEVVALIRAGQKEGRAWIALKGNHEAFCVFAWCREPNAMKARALMDHHRRTLDAYKAAGQDMADDVEWMEQLPTHAVDAHRVYVHAFAPQAYDLARAPEELLLWPRYGHGVDVGYRGKHVVHGHVPHIGGPELLSHRSNLDAGAVYGGALVAGVFNDSVAGGPIRLLRVCAPANNKGPLGTMAGDPAGRGQGDTQPIDNNVGPSGTPCHAGGTGAREYTCASPRNFISF